MVEPISDNDLTRLRLDADHNLLRTLASMDVGTLRSILARLDAAEAERDRLRAEAAAPARGKVSREMVEKASRVVHDAMDNADGDRSDEHWAKVVAWERAQAEQGWTSPWTAEALAVIAALGLEVEDA